MDQDQSVTSEASVPSSQTDKIITHEGYEEHDICLVYSSYIDNMLGPLSTYSPFSVIIGNRTYPTAEHAIQCERMYRLGYVKEGDILLTKKTPHQCHRRGETVFLKECTLEQRKHWNDDLKLKVITEALFYRIKQNEIVSNCLMSTVGNRLLAYQDDSSRIDLEGIIHQQIRDQNIQSKNDTPE